VVEFDRLLTTYYQTDRLANAESSPAPKERTGQGALLDRFADATFNRGLYRLPAE
jgi:hypothetical protein